MDRNNSDRWRREQIRGRQSEARSKILTGEKGGIRWA